MRYTVLFPLLLLLGLPSAAVAQSSLFTYQGRFADSGQPANGNYDFQFRLADAAASGNYVGAALTNAPVPLSNGLFTVALDFGSAAFDGTLRWLEIAVRTNGSAAPYTVLVPRQALTATPYALYAANAKMAGTATNLVLGGGVYGNGAGITNLSGTSIQPETIPPSAFTAGVTQWVQSAASTLATDPLSRLNTTNNVFAFGGDSRSLPWPTYASNGLFFSNRFSIWTNFAVSGQGIYSQGPAFTNFANAVPLNGRPGYFFENIGINDIISLDAQTLYERRSNLWRTAQGYGFKVTASTLPVADDSWRPLRSSVTDNILAHNAMVRSSTNCDGVLDFAALLPDPWDVNLFSADHVHYTTAGNLLVAQYVNAYMMGLGRSLVSDVGFINASNRLAVGSINASLLNFDPAINGGTFTGTFTGNGAGLTNVLATSLVATSPESGITTNILYALGFSAPANNGSFYYQSYQYYTNGAGWVLANNVDIGAWVFTNANGVIDSGYTGQPDSFGFPTTYPLLALFGNGTWVPPADDFDGAAENGYVYYATNTFVPVFVAAGNTLRAQVPMVVPNLVATGSLSGSVYGSLAGGTNFYGTNIAPGTMQSPVPGALWQLLKQPPYFFKSYITSEGIDSGVAAGLYTGTFITNAVETLLTNGMVAAGLNWILLDDGWQAFTRDANGFLSPNPTNFAGFTNLVKYIHGKGLKAMIYSSFSPSTCMGRPGSTADTIGKDVAYFCSLGFDGMFMDYCGYHRDTDLQSEYAKLEPIARELAAHPENPMVYFTTTALWPTPSWLPYSCNVWNPGIGTAGYDYIGGAEPAEFVAHMKGLLGVITNMQGPGRWMYCGSQDSGSPYVDNARFTATLLAILGSPTSVGYNYGGERLFCLTNIEISGIRMDAGCIPGQFISSSSNAYTEVWTRQLGYEGSGINAVALLNYGTNGTKDITVNLTACGLGTNVYVRDCWYQTNMPPATTSITVSVPQQSAALLMLSRIPQSGGGLWLSGPTVTNYTALPAGSLATTPDGGLWVLEVNNSTNRWTRK